ncbi:MAG: XisI protein [Okeania sp. SIO3C4]|nr:XisI protein [Okeania sp. SIO3C4]
MDNTIDFYKQCVKQILSEYEYLKDEDSQIELIFDDERMRYMAFWVGWYKYKRIHQCVVHIDIVGDNIIIQCNDTEESIVEKLVEMGISQENISLNFIHPQHRDYLEIAT